jgi:hypothetical protein
LGDQESRLFETFDFSIDRCNDFELVHLLNIPNCDSTKMEVSSPSEGGL